MNVTDVATIAPWAPYREDVFPRSSGRVLLGEALATYMLLMDGNGAEQIAAAFEEGGDERIRDRTISAARLIGMLLLEGRLTAWARPIGGGEAVELEPQVWELDDFTHRFATCALDLRRPFDASSPPTHRIFIGDEDHRAIFEACCDDVPRPIVKRRAKPQSVPEQDLVPAQPAATARAVDRHIRMPELEELTGMKRATIYKRIRLGRFPRQVDAEDGMARWWESDVAAWLANPR
jgi:prophage regulatory protein